jgi:hypothetical protein
MTGQNVMLKSVLVNGYNVPSPLPGQGYSIYITNCENCMLWDSVVSNSLRGAMVAVDSPDLRVVGNLWIDNSTATSIDAYPYVDQSRGGGGGAMEVVATLKDTKSTITDNWIFDAGDGGIVLQPQNDHLMTGEVTNNAIIQRYVPMMGTSLLVYTQPEMTGRLGGPYSTQDPNQALIVHHNYVNCDWLNTGRNLCAVGMGVGGQQWWRWLEPKNPDDPRQAADPAHDWWPRDRMRIRGGIFKNNTIVNARIGINVDGAGQASAPDGMGWTTVVDNYVGGRTLEYARYNLADEIGQSNDIIANFVAAPNGTPSAGQQVGGWGYYCKNGCNGAIRPDYWWNLNTSYDCAHGLDPSTAPSYRGTFCAGAPGGGPRFPMPYGP